ncbi:tetratricopeptide repeat protein [Bradyrhizobium centrosematis]|uniref:tetratricopeptide repeat protein n=1 Tax=Bradyrhizobium centrosematis TaxID=1300039 RepID=UPI00388EC3A8
MANPDGLKHLPAPPASDPSKSADILSISGPERDLLCALSYVHLACGQSTQSLALLRIAAREHSNDVGLLRIFAYTLISERLGEEALQVLDRLQALDVHPSSRIPMTLLRSHALRQAGRMAEAREVFQAYVSLRASTALIKQQ